MSPGTEFARDFCAGTGPLQLGVVLFVIIIVVVVVVVVVLTVCPPPIVFNVWCCVLFLSSD